MLEFALVLILKEVNERRAYETIQNKDESQSKKVDSRHLTEIKNSVAQVLPLQEVNNDLKTRERAGEEGGAVASAALPRRAPARTRRAPHAATTGAGASQLAQVRANGGALVAAADGVGYYRLAAAPPPAGDPRAQSLLVLRAAAHGREAAHLCNGMHLVIAPPSAREVEPLHRRDGEREESAVQLAGQVGIVGVFELLLEHERVAAEHIDASDMGEESKEIEKSCSK